MKIILISGLIILDNNQNIIFTSYGEISLYDGLFNKIKRLDNISSTINSYLKINQNIFVYSTTLNKTIYVATIDNYELYKYTIQKSGDNFINYLENKKILISHDNEALYLINFNSLFPEVIQKIQIDIYTKDSYFKNLNFIDNFYKEDSIYIRIEQKSFENDLFYSVHYIVQYKVYNDELKEVSRIEEK